MEKITFKCETITPMFCYGADQKTPEIRAASIKGGLRFWWRALNGHLVENNDYTKLREKETEIFGGSGTDDSAAQRSKVIVRVVYEKLIKDSYQPLPHHDNSDSCNKCKKNRYTQNCVKSFKSRAIMPNNIFSVILRLSPNEYFSFTEMKSLFIIFSILGGIGKRARRGFGSFKINQIDNVPYNENINLAYILQQIRNINSSFTWNQPPQGKKYPYLKNVQVGKSGSYASLLHDIGKASSANSYSDYTGFVKGKNRLSSPLYISTIFNNSLKIISSRLNCSFANKWTPKGKKNAVNNFRQNLQEAKNEQ